MNDIENLSDEENTVSTVEPSQTTTQSFLFHGTGSEYFRIWIVNILLTLLTLGVYSAWAKVRRMQYFYENTELMGARFGYHADPIKVLKGRILAVLAVVGFYSLAYLFPAIEPLGSLIWVALLPALLCFALYFRLRNTSYRGLRFAFSGSLRQAYIALRLPLTLSLLGLAAVAIALHFFEENKSFGMFWGIVLTLVYVLFPIFVMPMFQVQWKRFAHEHSQYGTEQFGFSATVMQYTKTYLGSFAVFLLLVIPIAIILMLFILLATKILKQANGLTSLWPSFSEILVFIGFIYVILFSVAPYLKAKFFNLAWSNTQIGGHRFAADVPVIGFMGVSAANFFLILLTLGFYRPFAVIRTQKYLLAHLYLNTLGEPAEIFKMADSSKPSATSEGALDLFGDMDM